MLLAAVLATVFATSQGRVVDMTFPDEPGVKSMQVVWNEKKIPVAHVEKKWETIVGVDLDTKPGDHAANVEVTFADGRIDRRPITFQVAAVKFPTTELKVDDQYVQLSPANQQRAGREAKEL